MTTSELFFFFFFSFFALSFFGIGTDRMRPDADPIRFLCSRKTDSFGRVKKSKEILYKSVVQPIKP